MTEWAEPHLPGLEPHTGRLDARYSRWLGACPNCRAATLTVTARNQRTYLVDVRPIEGGNLALNIKGDTLTAHVPMPDKRDAATLYRHHECKRKAHR